MSNTPIHYHSASLSVAPYTARRSIDIDTSDLTEFVLSIPNILIQEILTSRRGLVRKPGPAIKGTAEGFESKIHDLVPQLKDLTDEDLAIIGESKKFDPDSE